MTRDRGYAAGDKAAQAGACVEFTDHVRRDLGIDPATWFAMSYEGRLRAELASVRVR